MTTDQRANVDPDPFAVGLGLFQILAAGVTFLEARRQRQAVEQAQRERFRTAYYQAKRTLIHFRRVLDEFESYMLEGRFGRNQFRIGMVRLSLEPGQHQAVRRLHGQALVTANHIADDLDDLSDFLGPRDQTNIDAIHERLGAIEALPTNYRGLIALCRDAIQLYQELLDDIDEREGFDEDTSS